MLMRRLTWILTSLLLACASTNSARPAQAASIPADTQSTPTEEEEAGIPADKRGMTWVQSTSDSCGQTRVICNDCDPYEGDTLCTESRPLLCFKPDAFEDCSAPTSSTDGWASGTLALTSFLVPGTQLVSEEAANEICARTFGPGYRMAEFHDGGSWGMRAKGAILPLPTSSSTHPRLPVPNLPNRFWININDQLGNCWD